MFALLNFTEDILFSQITFCLGTKWLVLCLDRKSFHETLKSSVFSSSRLTVKDTLTQKVCTIS